MARLNGGAVSAVLLFCAGGFIGTLAGAWLVRHDAAKAAAVIAAKADDAKAFGLACPASRSPGECESLCRALYIDQHSWGVCVKAVIAPALVGAADPAPELSGGPAVTWKAADLPPETLAAIRYESAFVECMGEDFPADECERRAEAAARGER